MQAKHLYYLLHPKFRRHIFNLISKYIRFKPESFDAFENCRICFYSVGNSNRILNWVSANKWSWATYMLTVCIENKFHYLVYYLNSYSCERRMNRNECQKMFPCVVLVALFRNCSENRMPCMNEIQQGRNQCRTIKSCIACISAHEHCTKYKAPTITNI